MRLQNQSVEERTSAFISKIREKFGDRFDLSKVKYLNNKTKITVSCPEHGEFSIMPQNLLKTCGCPKCGAKVGGKKRGEMSKKTLEQFITDAIKVHGMKYDYSKVEYKNNNTKICIICPEHGEFWQKPSNHLDGNGCPECAIISKRKQTKSNEDFIKNAIAVHGDKYDYSKTQYTGTKNKVKIICPKHGEFLQDPHNHLRGAGCPYCANKYKDLNDFISRANIIHKNKYSYDNSVYINAFTKIKITCPKHGEFFQTPYNHLQFHGCPKCSNPVSKWENDVCNFLTELGIEYEQSNRKILNGKEIDIFIPKYNIGIECDGIRWHSEEYGKDKNYHLNKTNECLKNGVRLIHIFEDEWINKPEIWKSMLRNIFGKTEKRIFARKCITKKVKPRDARIFLETNHIQGFSNGVYAYGLYYENELVSLMSFGKQRINLGGKKDERCYELVRFCNKLNTNVIGGASKLFKAFLKDFSPLEIVSYSDKRWSTGNLYNVLGFSYLHDSTPNYFYVVGNHRENRFKYRKSILVNEGFDKDKTEHQIMLERGIFRVYDCGTMVWVWEK